MIKLPTLLPVGVVGLLGKEDNRDIDEYSGVTATNFTHRPGKPETAVIRPDYLLEYINMALTCQ